jgi:hypothetical protein
VCLLNLTTQSTFPAIRDEVNGIDEDQYANLEVKRNSIETDQAQMLEDMKAKGEVDPAIADRAVASYKQGMSLHDVNNAVRAATKRVPVAGKVTEVTDPNGLATRLQKLNDVPATGGLSRLEQAIGKDNAEALMSHVDNAQVAQQTIKEFVPSSPTGKQALADLLRPNTEGKLIGSGAKTNFLKAYSDFDKLGPEEQAARFGNDVGAARSYLQGKARMQLAKRIALGVGVGAVAKETGLSKYLLHFLLE